MKLGVSMFATDYAIRPDELARAVEERGFESLWLPEHTHIPSSRVSPWPGGGTLPKEYWHTHDLFVALAMAAAVTRELKVASGICLVVERDPITLAKEVATIDALSDGRFLFGIGGGWNAEEMANHGTEFEQRWMLLRERIEAMKAIWTQDEAEYHGELVNFDPIWSWPKPTQKPHPPIILGGHGPRALRRVARYCDGWMPIAARAGDLREEIEDLRARLDAVGRDPASVQVSVYAVSPDHEVLAQHAELDVARVILPLPSVDRDRALRLLDRHVELLRRFQT